MDLSNFDFNAMERTRIDGMKGGLGSVFTKAGEDDTVKVIDMVVPPESSIGWHVHESGWEIMFFTEGTFLVNYDGEEITASAGTAHYCPNGHGHSIKNVGETDARFYAVVAK